ncbi:4'-phosphopantetheinyl transferase family protein [Oceanisphaera sp.]|uniref:4'-phosphopantetheinyl transferase family protein n=1 Tax=Oceanisphaera sp. TaxID=1929979 RepID=UPI003A9555D6
MSKNKVIFTRALICDASRLQLPANARLLLSAAEQDRYGKMQHPRQARLFLLGRYLLRQLLATSLKQAPEHIRILIDHKGKPVLNEPGWHFNISHSGDLLALAFGNQAPLGIDVESRQLSGAQITRLARRYLTTNEQQWLDQGNNTTDAFLQLWTIKEAVLKAHGSGIANNLSAVHWQPHDEVAHFDDAPYQLHQFRHAHSRLTLAINSATGVSVDCLKLCDLPFELEITGSQPNLDNNALNITL